MTAIFLELIKHLNSSVFVLLGICVVVAIFIFRMGGIIERFKHHEEKICDLGNMGERLIKLETKVDLIYQNTNPRAMVQAHSPMSLTLNGENVAKNLNANTLLNKYILKLKRDVEAEIESKTPPNAYDIQIASLKVAKEKMLSYFDEKELISVKDEAYNNGTLLEDIMSVFGILLRNAILQERGIPIADVDLHEKKQ
jgi:hypothetical protein